MPETDSTATSPSIEAPRHAQPAEEAVQKRARPSRSQGRPGAVGSGSGRRKYPLGQEMAGLPFRGPPGLSSTAAWPPTVADAKVALKAVAAARAGHQGHGLNRSVRLLFDYAGALAVRGARAGVRGEDDLIAAFSVFQRASSCDTGTKPGGLGNPGNSQFYRGASLYNATICLDLLPYRTARGLAAQLLVRAVEAIGEEFVGHFRDHLVTLGERLEAPLVPLHVDWRGPKLLVPAQPKAAARVRAFDGLIEGSWEGVRASLGAIGLCAPLACLNPSRVLAVRRKGVSARLEVASA